MVLAICGIVLLLGVYLLRKFLSKNTEYSPTNIFCLWWAACLAMSLFPVWGRHIASIEIYGTILLAIIFFLIGGLLGQFRYSVHKFCSISYQNECHSKFLNVVFSDSVPYRAIRLLNIIVLILNCWLFIQCFSQYGTSMFLEIGIARQGIYDKDGILNGVIAQYLHSYFMRSMLYALVVYLPLYFGIKKYNNIMIFTMLNILFYTFIYGGRMFVFYMGVLLLVGIRIRNSIGKSSRVTNKNLFTIRMGATNKNNIRMWFVVAILIAIVILLSFQRNNSSQQNDLKYFIEKSMTYFSSAPMYYQYLQEQTTVAEQSGFHFTLIGGLFSILSKLNRVVGLQIFPYAVEEVSTHLTSQLVNVGGSVYTNAFPTMVYTFRYDFGLIGIIVNSLAFGFIAEQVFRKLTHKRTTKWFCFYMITVYFIIESPMRWTGQQPWPFVVILIVLLVDKLHLKRYNGEK